MALPDSSAFQHRTCLFSFEYHKKNRNNRHVRQHALSATTTGRLYPGRNNDCGRHNYPTGSARDSRVPSGTKTSASLADKGRSAAHRSRRRSICNRNPEAVGRGCIRHRLDRLSEKRDATLHNGKGSARARFRFADCRSNPNHSICNVRCVVRCC